MLDKERKLSDGVVAALKAALGEFKAQYRRPTAGQRGVERAGPGRRGSLMPDDVLRGR